MAHNGFRWVKPPEAEMLPALRAYGKKVLVAVAAVADFMAQKMQANMRDTAAWEDRTGNARSGLFSVARQEAAGAVVRIYLSHGHTIDYGKFLELAHGKRYAIIVPTMQAYLPEIEAMLKNIFG